MIRVVTTLAECRALWNQFSPHEHVWDEWAVMLAYHGEDRYAFHFLVHETDGVVDGLVPLVQDTKEGNYELFGTCYGDNRKLWIQTKDFPSFYEKLPDNTSLFDLHGAQVRELVAAHPEFAPNFVETDERYFLLPEEFGRDFNTHMEKFSGDKRKHLKAELRKIKELQPATRVSDDDESELFIALCNRNFGDESDYQSDEGKQEIHRVVAALKEKGFLKTVTVSINGKKEAVSLSALYNDVLVVAYSASNNDIKNLGKFLNATTIQHGCDVGVREINYMTGMKWKADWKMNTETCYTFRKPARKPSA